MEVSFIFVYQTFIEKSDKYFAVLTSLELVLFKILTLLHNQQ